MCCPATQNFFIHFTIAVVWKNAVDSLNEASRHLLVSQDARNFVETYMKPVISILLEQQPHKIGQMERNCVEDSLKLAVIIVTDDLRVKDEASSGECAILEVPEVSSPKSPSFLETCLLTSFFPTPV